MVCGLDASRGLMSVLLEHRRGWTGIDGDGTMKTSGETVANDNGGRVLREDLKFDCENALECWMSSVVRCGASLFIGDGG